MHIIEHEGQSKRGNDMTTDTEKKREREKENRPKKKNRKKKNRMEHVNVEWYSPAMRCGAR